jgi:hypothetical protein
MKEMLWTYSDAAFRQVVRMDKASFLGVLQLISPHGVFHRITRNKYKRYYKEQKPIWIQLMLVVLIRVGCNGNGVSLGAVGRNCRYSTGAIVKFTQRVVLTNTVQQSVHLRSDSFFGLTKLSDKLGETENRW